MSAREQGIIIELLPQQLWDIRTKAQVHCLTGHTNTVAAVVANGFDPQVRCIFAVSSLRVKGFVGHFRISRQHGSTLGHSRGQVHMHPHKPQEVDPIAGLASQRVRFLTSSLCDVALPCIRIIFCS